jgi:hypothetical protein
MWLLLLMTSLLRRILKVEASVIQKPIKPDRTLLASLSRCRDAPYSIERRKRVCLAVLAIHDEMNTNCTLSRPLFPHCEFLPRGNKCLPSAMKDLYLRLHFSSDVDLAYPNPVAWTCLEIAGCSYWSTSTRVSWSLPANTYATFYESEKCVAAGQFHFLSDMKDTSSSFKLKTPHSFRSMMVSDATYPRPSIVYLDNCPSGKENGSLEDASLSFNGTDFNASTVGGAGDTATMDVGLSSNWNDDLRE